MRTGWVQSGRAAVRRVLTIALLAALTPAPAHAGRGRLQELLDAWTSGVVTVRVPPPRASAACRSLRVRGSAIGPSYDWRWEQVGGPAVAIDDRGFGVATLRTPALGETARIALRMTARSLLDGSVASATTEIEVAPAPVAEGLVPGAFLDCAPFEYGVASGDPLPESVLLWTRVTPEPETSAVTVGWQVATDAGFANVVASGDATADAASDFTIEVEAAGLSPRTDYFYRFVAPDGRSSALGRTRTAPRGAVDRVRLAVASCSSLFSGYFSAYGHVADRDDLDLLVHLGDYIYDFVDEDEQVRIPLAFPEEPADLDGWRQRHKDYLADPDLRRARAALPWAVIWDNHDVDAGAAPEYAGSVRAFREWIPIRETDPARPEIIYRRIAYGDLVDVVMLDALLHRNRDLVPGSSELDILGTEQMGWLEEQLTASTAAWRVMGNQRAFATVRVDPRLAVFISGDPRPVFDPRTWDGFPASRTRVIDFLAANGIGDNVVLSGDSHVSIANDIVDFPGVPYDPSTGEGAVGVEYMPTSISRGNFDETLLGLGFSEDALPDLIEFLASDTAARNPHQVYSELTLHGYGILDLTPERAQAEYWYVPILEPNQPQALGRTLVAPRGANRWTRE